jgi:hypothetical protein
MSVIQRTRLWQLNIIIAVIALLAFSCNESTSPDNNNNSGITVKGDIAATPNGFLLPIADGVAYSGYMKSSYDGSRIHLSAEYYLEKKTGDAGVIKINGNVVDKFEPENNVYYYSFGQTDAFNGISFNGMSHNWEVEGSSDVAAFTASVNTPNRVPTIGSPDDAAIVKKADGFTVTWSNTSSSSVYIEITQSDENDKLVSAYGKWASSSSYPITPEQLAQFKAGKIILRVKSVTTQNITAPDNKKYKAIAETYRQISLNLE